MSKSTVVANIDDTDPRIKYSGSWAPSSNVVDALGFSGIAMNRSLHEGTSAGSTMTFEFDGTAIGLFGTVASSVNRTIPRYTCRVDGVGFDEEYKYGIVQTNQYPLCEQITLLDGHHIATLTIDQVTDGIPLLFDYAAYWPSPGAKLNDTVAQVQFNDSRVQFSAGWSVYGDFDYHHYSTQKSSTVKFTFEGQSVTMYGFIPNGTLDASSSSYTLDGASAVSFSVPASKSTRDAYYNYPYFNLTGLSQSQHTLVVTDDSSHNDESPVTMSIFEIRGHPATDSGGGGGPGTGTGTGSRGGLATGAIAGIAVGGAVLLAIMSLLIWFLIVLPKKKRQGGPNHETLGDKFNEPVTPTPFSPTSATPFHPYGPQSPSFHQNNAPTPTPLLHTVASPPSSSPQASSRNSRRQSNHYYTPPSSAGSTIAPPLTLTPNRNSSSHHSLPPTPPSPTTNQPRQLITTDIGGGTRLSWRSPIQHQQEQADPTIDVDLMVPPPEHTRRRRSSSRPTTGSSSRPTTGNSSRPTTGNSSKSRPGSSRSQMAEPQYVEHEDSGMRLIDVPPKYQEL